MEVQWDFQYYVLTVETKYNTMKTAVEWLIEEWLHLDAEFDMALIDRNTYWEKLKEIQRQAKEMEKKQLYNFIDFINERHFNSFRISKDEVEHYYNQTFKKEQ